MRVSLTGHRIPAPRMKVLLHLAAVILTLTLLSGCISMFVGPDPIPGSTPYVPSQAPDWTDFLPPPASEPSAPIPPIPVYDGNGNQVGGF